MSKQVMTGRIVIEQKHKKSKHNPPQLSIVSQLMACLGYDNKYQNQSTIWHKSNQTSQARLLVKYDFIKKYKKPKLSQNLGFLIQL